MNIIIQSTRRGRWIDDSGRWIDDSGRWIDDNGNIHIKNISAFWIPELTTATVIHGCTYTVTGSYEGDRNFLEKLERITSKNFAEKLEKPHDKCESLC